MLKLGVPVRVLAEQPCGESAYLAYAFPPGPSSFEDAADPGGVVAVDLADPVSDGLVAADSVGTKCSLRRAASLGVDTHSRDQLRCERRILHEPMIARTRT